MVSSLFSTSSGPLRIGHRGASGHAVENSALAFRIAATPGHPGECQGVELDLQTTSDGGFVVHHDAVLATGDPIAELPLSRVCATALADGSALPTLDEALDLLAGLRVFIEVKGLPPSSDASLIATLRAHDLERIAVHAFDHRVVARLRLADPALSVGVLSRSYPLDAVAQVTAAGADTLWQEAHFVDAPLVAACRRAGVAVVAWTVNDPAEAARLSELGVDGLCGDWPERLGGVVGR